MNELRGARVEVRQPEEIADRLHSVAIHLLRSLRKQDEVTGISAPRLSALSVIVFAGPVTLGDLAAAEQVRPPTISRLIAGLEADGLVERLSDSTDRRVVRVKATPAGRRMLEEGRHRRISALAQRLHGSDPGELEVLDQAAGILDRLLKDSR